MNNFCEGESRGGFILAAMVAAAEIFSLWWARHSEVEIMEELAHFKDESRHLRAELERVREKYLAAEKELHQVNLSFESYIYANPPQEEVEASED